VRGLNDFLFFLLEVVANRNGSDRGRFVVAEEKKERKKKRKRKRKMLVLSQGFFSRAMCQIRKRLAGSTLMVNTPSV